MSASIHIYFADNDTGMSFSGIVTQMNACAERDVRSYDGDNGCIYQEPGDCSQTLSFEVIVNSPINWDDDASKNLAFPKNKTVGECLKIAHKILDEEDESEQTLQKISG